MREAQQCARELFYVKLEKELRSESTMHVRLEKRRIEPTRVEFVCVRFENHSCFHFITSDFAGLACRPGISSKTFRMRIYSSNFC